MKNYLIPYGRRELSTGRNPIFSKLMCIDNVGLFVLYNKDEEDKLTPEYLRKFLIGYNSQNKVLIKAENLDDALTQFNEMDGVKTGHKHKAITLEDDKNNPIIEYTGCPHMIDEDSGFKCGQFDEPDEPHTMMCVLDGMDDPHDSCPIHIQREKHRPETKCVGGVWIKTYSELCAPVNLSESFITK